MQSPFPLGRFFITALLVGFLALGAGVPTANASDFIRGDANGDQSFNFADITRLLSYIVELGEGPVSTCENEPLASLDAGDINDNEYITIADVLRGNAQLFGSGSPPAVLIPFPPQTCGLDPDQDTKGFNAINPDYKVFIGDAIVLEVTPNRRARYPLFIQTTGNTIAMELYFAFPPGTLSNPQFVQGDDTLAPVTLQELISNVVVVRLTDPIASPFDLQPGVVFYGYLQFDLDVVGDAPTLDWVPELFASFQRRSTFVDSQFDDHHPEFVEGENLPFIRGDVSTSGSDALGDGQVDAGDLQYWLTWYLFDTPDPISVCGPFPVRDALDTNDNEYITPADYLLIEEFILSAGPVNIPAPNSCDPDPTGATNGFEARDIDYHITTSETRIVINSPSDIVFEVDLVIDTPLDIRAIQLSLRMPAGMTASSNLFTPSLGVTSTPIAERQMERLVMFSAGNLAGAMLNGAPGTWQELGTLRFNLDAPALSAPLVWVANANIGDRTYRSSVVDINFQDHHPVTTGGSTEFIRGDANNQPTGSTIDISDAIFLFDYLFSSGSAPSCFDSADTNNDGEIDIGDPISILLYLFQNAPDLDAPFDNCGLDSDIDLLDCQQSACP